MKPLEVSCPSCGSTVEFTVRASLVAVCRSCGTVVARTDRKIEDHGKVAAIVQTDSAFHLGLSGRYRQHPFKVVGRVQYNHPTGGLWEEWYVAFPGDRWGWIAEAQGRRYFTELKKITHHMTMPAFESLSVGQPVKLGDKQTFIIEEFATATLASAEGEVPFTTYPNSPHQFADLNGPQEAVATLSYKPNQIELFVGEEVGLDKLGISAPANPLNDEASMKFNEANGSKGLALTCPNCGGSVELRAPDKSQRATCSYCASLLDVQGTNLRYLSTLDTKIKPLLPIGSVGDFDGTKYTVIGFVRRSVMFDREYTWDEYLLYEFKIGFRWLVDSDFHWSWVEPADDVTEYGKKTAKFDGDRYRLYQRAWARVQYVYGEFYWKVSLGDTVLMLDYVFPPYTLTIEKTPVGDIPARYSKAQQHLNYQYSEVLPSLGTYVSPEVVERAFKLKPLQRGAAIAPNQPSPNYTSVYVLWPFMVLLLVAVDYAFSSVLKYTISHEFTFFAVVALSLFPIGLMLHRRAFERSRWADSEFNPYESN